MVNPKPSRQKRAKPTAYLLALGEYCRKLRVQRGYSIDRLAKESDRLSPSVIQRLETGAGPVNVTNLHRFAEALELKVRDLFAFEEALQPKSHSQPRILPPDSPEVEEKAFRTHLPLYSLAAAAGKFGAAESVEALGWVEAKSYGALTKDMFVAQAIGHSMEPKILDKDYLVFRMNPEGTRQGKVVLAQYRGAADPETGGSYTVKVYSSVRVEGAGEGEPQKQVTLSPLNPDYEPLQLSPERAEDVRIVAEYLFTL